MNKIKSISQYIIIIMVLLSPLLLYLNSVYYIDIFHLSMIKIETDIIRGEKASIKKAIKKIKKEDARSYRILHKYVSRISEKNCIVADHMTHEDEYKEGLKLPGCYVRGSKTIYLIPSTDLSAKTIAQRAENISHLSELSMNYWTGE